MLHIERPSGADITDSAVTLTVRDENGLRAATVIVSASQISVNDEVIVLVKTVPGDDEIRTTFEVVKG